MPLHICRHDEHVSLCLALLEGVLVTREHGDKEFPAFYWPSALPRCVCPWARAQEFRSVCDLPYTLPLIASLTSP